jgi:methyltransferase (TIGR00027 family)
VSLNKFQISPGLTCVMKPGVNGRRRRELRTGLGVSYQRAQVPGLEFSRGENSCENSNHANSTRGGRAIPSTEHRIIDDGLAARLLPFGGRAFVGLLRMRWMRDWIIALSEKSNPGIWGGLLWRKRYIDETLVASRNEIKQVVNLGAGFDTRAYRLPSLSGVPVWEIDQRENAKAKESQLRKVFRAIPSNVKLVPADFDHDDLASILAAQGFSAGKATFFIWEAVTQYLTERAVRATFDWLAKAAPGSHLVFTYVRKNFLNGKALCGWENGYRRFVATKVWLFGMEPEDCPTFLRGYGWQIIEDVGYDELADKYIGPTRRQLRSTPVERIVHAVRP